jgi:hypothetical protein
MFCNLAATVQDGLAQHDPPSMAGGGLRGEGRA